MSLDVELTMPGVQQLPRGKRIFIREDGQTKEISREEWDRRFPGRTPYTVELPDDTTDCVYSGNITHNLSRMADEAGLHDCMWTPQLFDITKAKQLIEPLTKGLERLKSNPERFKAFNPENGWGTYDGLVRFVEEYLAACLEYPEADVHAWR